MRLYHHIRTISYNATENVLKTSPSDLSYNRYNNHRLGWNKPDKYHKNSPYLGYPQRHPMAPSRQQVLLSSRGVPAFQPKLSSRPLHFPADPLPGFQPMFCAEPSENFQGVCTISWSMMHRFHRAFFTPIYGGWLGLHPYIWGVNCKAVLQHTISHRPVFSAQSLAFLRYVKTSLIPPTSIHPYIWGVKHAPTTIYRGVQSLLKNEWQKHWTLAQIQRKFAESVKNVMVKVSNQCRVYAIVVL